jgi:hypothetical protein
VAPPGGAVSGVASGAPLVGRVGVTVSARALRSRAGVQKEASPLGSTAVEDGPEAAPMGLKTGPWA